MHAARVCAFHIRRRPHRGHHRQSDALWTQGEGAIDGYGPIVVAGRPNWPLAHAQPCGTWSHSTQPLSATDRLSVSGWAPTSLLSRRASVASSSGPFPAPSTPQSSRTPARCQLRVRGNLARVVPGHDGVTKASPCDCLARTGELRTCLGQSGGWASPRLVTSHPGQIARLRHLQPCPSVHCARDGQVGPQAWQLRGGTHPRGSLQAPTLAPE